MPLSGDGRAAYHENLRFIGRDLFDRSNIFFMLCYIGIHNWAYLTIRMAVLGILDEVAVVLLDALVCV